MKINATKSSFLTLNAKNIGYNKAFIGLPQPFHYIIGEYGPPLSRTAEVDWKFFSFALTIADILITIALCHLIRTWPEHLRLVSVSSTLRFTVGIIYGCWRCSLIIYLFRTVPNAFYIYFALGNFVLYTYLGLIALLFKRGIGKYLRSGKHGVYRWETKNNPMFLLTQSFQIALKRIEYKLLHSVQALCYFGFEKKKEITRKELRFFGLKFRISEILKRSDDKENQIILTGPGYVKITTSVMKWNEAILFCSQENMIEHFDCNYIDIEKKSRRNAENSRNRTRRSSVSSYIYRSETQKFICLDDSMNKNQPSLGKLKRRKRANSANSRLMSRESDIYARDIFGTSWLNAFSDSFKDEDLGGPANIKLHRCLVKVCLNGLIYSIDCSKPLPDIKQVLNISTRKRRSKTRSKYEKAKSSEKYFSCIEIVGKQEECLSGNKLFFFYSDFRRLKLTLNAVQKKTVLWLLNSLNNTSEKQLSVFKTCDSFKYLN